jgi:hypothetical protein
MLKSWLNSKNFLPAISGLMIYFFYPYAEAQTVQDIAAAKNLISSLYKLNAYEHECYTLKDKGNEAHAKSVLRNSTIYDFPEKAQTFYSWKTEEDQYWNVLFHEYYVDAIAREYALRCYKNYTLKNVEERSLQDFRFPYMFDENASLIIRNLIFWQFKIDDTKLVIPVTVNLRNRKKFTLTYILHKEFNAWRILDIIEYAPSADRSDFFVNRSLLSSVEEWKNRDKR